jgi:hypothetical protein
MAYSIRLPDGTTVANIPDDVSFEDARAQILKMQPGLAPAATKAAGFSLADTALGLGQGVIGAGKSLTDVFGADNAVSEALGRGQAALGEMKTPERQAEQAARQAKIKAAEGTGFLNEIGAELGAVKDAPIQATAQALGSFAPYLLTGIVGGVAKLLPATVRVINTIVGAAQGAGSIKGSIYDAVYNELRGTMPADKAKEQAAIAQEYNAANALDIAGGTLLGAVGARTGVESQLIKGAGANAPAKFLPRVGQAVLKESPLEGAQGGQEKVAQNRALQRAGFDVPTFQGVAGRAAGDAAMGALAAGAVSTVQGGKATGEADPYAGLSTIKDTGATEPTAPEAPTTPAAEVSEYVQLQRRKAELLSEPRNPENKAELAAINKQIEVLNIKLVEDERAKIDAIATDEAKAKQSAFNLPPEGAQMEMAGVGTTDRLPPEVDANGNPLRPFVGPDRDVGLGDVIAAELPPTTEILNDAGIAPTQAELEAAGQQQLGFPNPISEAEVTAFGASMSKTNRKWLADNLLGKTPDQVRDEVAAKQLVVPENKGIQKVIKEIVANVTPKEPQNAPSTQPTIQPTPRARGRKPSVDVSVPPTDASAAATAGQPEGLEGQRLVPPEQSTATGNEQQGRKPLTLKPRVEVDTAEIARRQEAADLAARLAEQAQASALGKPAPEQRTVVEDRSKANREAAVRRAEEAAQKLETATTEEEKAKIRQKAPKASAISTAQIVGTLKELIRSPQVSAKDKQDAKRHLEAVQEKKGKDVSAGKEDDLSEEMAFNFLVEQASKPRFQRTETPTTPMLHEKVKAVVAGIVAKWKNAPEVIVVRDMNDAAVPQAVRDHNNEQLAGGAKGSPAGFYHDGKVYIVSSQVSSAADVMTTLAHEALGHFGLRGVFGTALDTELKTIEATYKAEMEAVAAKYGLDLSDPKQASEAAEEVLANLAQTKPTLGIVQRAVAAIRAFIRRIMPSLQMTNNDIIAKFILPARAFVESGAQTSISDIATRFNLRGKITAPTTEAFKRWFGNSKVVDDNGDPLVVYHGTLNDFSVFELGPKSNRVGNPDGYYFSPSARDASEYTEKRTFNNATKNIDVEQKLGGRVMPVFLSIQNPFVEGSKVNSAMYAQFEKELRADNENLGEDWIQSKLNEFDSRKESSFIGLFPNITFPPAAKTRVLEAGGYDGFKDGRHWVAIKPTQVKSATGNRGTYDPTNPDIRFARVAPSVEALVDGAGDLSPEERGMFTKFMDAFAAVPGVDRTTAFRTQTADIAATVESRLRAKFDGKVRDAVGNLNPMGLYRQAQDQAKMLLQYLQVGNIEKEASTGLWKVTPKEGVRAPAEVYTMLEAWGKKNGYSFDMAKKIASRILEGVRLNQMRISNRAGMTNFQLHAIDKTSSLSLDQQINEMLKEYNAQPDLQEISRVMDAARIALVDHMVEVGRLTPEMGKEWRDVVGYVPFDRMDEFAKAYTKIKRSGSRGIAQVGKLPELVGSFTKPVGDVFGNYMNTLGWMMRQVIHTDATVRTLGALEDINFAKPLGLTNQGKDYAVPAYVNGEVNYWQLHTKYDEMAFKDLNIPQADWIRNLGTFSNVLRTTVTALPPFALKQVTDDVQRAIMTSGVKNPAALVRMTLTNFPKLVMAELRGIEHPMVKMFGAYGLSGEYDFQQAKPADSLLKDMKLVKRSVFRNLLHKLDGITRASDLAVRAAIYEQTLVESKGDTLLAQTRAREFINFRRRGASEAVGAMVTTIPFFNAYVQGMDVLYRAASGKDASASNGRAMARSMFVSRAVTVAFISSLYALGKSDDDDYNNMDLRQRDSNWIFPGGYKLPVPGELGAIFKVVPERVVEYMRRQGTPEEQTAFEAVRTALAYMYEQYLGRVNPIPQAAKPLIEAWANKSFLTGKALEGFHHLQLDPSMRRTDATSELAIAIANFSRDTVGVEVSPIMIDNSLRGYFGSTAAMVTMVTDSLLNPDKVDRPLHKYALLSNYLTDPTGTRKITEFYDERDKSMAAKSTLQELMKVDVDRAVAYAEAHQDELIMAKGIQSTLNMLEKTRAYRKYLNGAEAARDMTADEREAALKEVKQMEVQYVAWVREAKAAIAQNR